MTGASALAGETAGGDAFWRRLLRFAGPGFLVAVGYMDPGNWATDIAGGSAHGYTLLSVVLLSSLMATLLQALSARLGVASGLDLAQACRHRYPRRVTIALWLLCEGAIVACDLAEVIGTAIALQLLFGLPLVWGVWLTALDVLLILALQRRGLRWLEAFIVALLLIVAGCFLLELIFARPDWGAAAAGLVPRPSLLTDPGKLYLAVGILGATVMPHNLYLHSALVKTRPLAPGAAAKADAIRLATWDSSIALTFAFFVNAAILTLAAAAFHAAGHRDVAEIGDAYRLLSPLLGAGSASILFGVALLASGQNSTVTGTLAGQIVMEGFVDWRLPPWARRLITRGLAVVPAAFVASAYGQDGATRLLIASQVVLSLQLPFAVVPLVRFTNDPAMMGPHASRGWLRAAAWGAAAVIVMLNLYLLVALVR
jgi:manganese transport protein